jgi:hypothetical protein
LLVDQCRFLERETRSLSGFSWRGYTVFDGDVLIDGRNRLKACQIAEVKPTFRQFPWNGNAEGKEDAIKAYIVGENIRRRHLNAGQRAILIAIAYPEPTPGKRTDLEQNVPGAGIRTTTLSQARTIVKWMPGLVEDILAGSQVFSNLGNPEFRKNPCNFCTRL